ncbi:hypothetical protein LJC55_04250 [Eubacteriales bacterium OttesenSCG-928-N14]|nr:hypothetical protein [Eubacteriales bacterium OttesenSCG-928-N14]
MEKARMILTHLCMIVAVLIGVLLVVDVYNPMMAFMDDTKTTIALWVLCIASLINGILYVIDTHRAK